MKRSTNTAPVSLSTSYLIGSARIGISMTTLQSLGTSLPAGTRSRLIGVGFDVIALDYTGPIGTLRGVAFATCMHVPERNDGRAHAGTARARAWAGADSAGHA